MDLELKKFGDLYLELPRRTTFFNNKEYIPNKNELLICEFISQGDFDDIKNLITKYKEENNLHLLGFPMKRFAWMLSNSDNFINLFEKMSFLNTFEFTNLAAREYCFEGIFTDFENEDQNGYMLTKPELSDEQKTKNNRVINFFADAVIRKIIKKEDCRKFVMMYDELAIEEFNLLMDKRILEINFKFESNSKKIKI